MHPHKSAVRDAPVGSFVQASHVECGVHCPSADAALAQSTRAATAAKRTVQKTDAERRFFCRSRSRSCRRRCVSFAIAERARPRHRRTANGKTVLDGCWVPYDGNNIPGTCRGAITSESVLKRLGGIDAKHVLLHAASLMYPLLVLASHPLNRQHPFPLNTIRASVATVGVPLITP